ncbi:uncharacterized protein DUF4157 [Brevibacillus sp. AG162]|uniref:eCIS core domain-containing protein n=1 Tax=Brevibacillus sp. AG162 TaxID=2572910 RepID=UPI0011707EBF|nr:DUF4157 domain-containing protein [Brevibacillus sp. AG162]TQK53604.1 uncharacterized protein DUF4157 [Brevibacillus sp. AG162]
MRSYSREQLHSSNETAAQHKTFSGQKQAHLLSLASRDALAPAQVMQLQQSMGNQAVLQLLRKKVIQPKKNETGMPDTLKSGLERLSGIDLSDVKVHYQSEKPKQIGALAYAQGTDIHLAPGQEQHLPHEGWHIVQQMQGRVKPTLQMQDSGVAVNDEVGLEDEADQMGAKALLVGDPVIDSGDSQTLAAISPPASKPIQGVWATIPGIASKVNLKTLTGEFSASGKQLYLLSETRQKYEEVSKIGDELIVKPYVEPVTASKIRPFYQSWTPAQTTNLSIDSGFGPVGAMHNRSAPYLTSKQEDFGGAKLRTTYKDFIRGLRDGRNTSKDDATLARALLNEDITLLDSDLQKRAAAMLSTTVNLAEEWRKHGASKIYRSLLRRIIAEKATFDDFLRDFEFIQSADAGRQQVARYQDYFDGEMDYEDLTPRDQAIIDHMSPIREDDFSSDDEQREEKKLKSKERLFAKRYHQEDEDDGNS